MLVTQRVKNGLADLRQRYSESKKEEVIKTYTPSVKEYELTFVDDEEGDEPETVFAHGFEKTDGRIVFFIRLGPATMIQTYDGFGTTKWEKAEVKGYGAETVRDWDVVNRESHEMRVRIELDSHSIENHEVITNGLDEVTIGYDDAQNPHDE